MPEFPYSRLRRWPDVEAHTLQAYDATDLLLVERALAVSTDAGITASAIAVIGDEYGAITLALANAGLRGIRVHQDLATGRRALERNARELAPEWNVATTENRDADDGARRVEARHAAAETDAPDSRAPFSAHELDRELLAGARLVLLQLPKSLAELEQIADAVARWAAPDVRLVAGGRVKHMTLAQNEVLAARFALVQPQRAERKSRLIVAAEPLPVPENPPFPVVVQHEGFTLAAFGGAFAGARIDIGTRVLLDVLGSGAYRPSADSGSRSRTPGETWVADPVDAPPTVVDLGCGTGALAVAFALTDPASTVIATDRSAAAVASARATVAANGLADRITVTHDDAGSELETASADVVLLNPPFHLGASVHTGAATRLFEAAARLLRPGGELYTVYNSSLGYRAELSRLVGATEQLHRTPKFTVTRSIRRG